MIKRLHELSVMRRDVGSAGFDVEPDFVRRRRQDGRVRSRTVMAAVLGGTLMVLAGCTYRGPADDFLTQRATWFSYLNGDDLRAACLPGAPERLRLVYNADFNRQARTYDVTVEPDGGAVVRQSVAQGLAASGRDLLDLGRPPRGESRMTAAEFADFESRLQESGAFDPPPVGDRLNAADTWWLVTGCRHSAYFLTAILYPSPQFDAIRFAEPLFRHDATGVPVVEPAEAAATTESENRCRDQGAEGYICFTLQVGADGLVGVATVD